MPTDYDKNKDQQTKLKTYAETFKNNRAQYYIMLADRFYNTYRCVVRGEYVDPEDMISLNSKGIDNIIDLKSQLCRIPRKPTIILIRLGRVKIGIKFLTYLISIVFMVRPDRGEDELCFNSTATWSA